MKSKSVQTTVENFEKTLEGLSSEGYRLLVLFSSTDNLKNFDFHTPLQKHLPGAELIGCSTSGEIGEFVQDNSVSFVAMGFDDAKFKCIEVDINTVDESRSSGRKLAEELAADDLKGVFVLMPGLNVNGSKFVQGLKEVLPSSLSISGGMAGDGLNFKETCTVHNGKKSSVMAVGLGIYGDKVTVSNRSRGGWKPFGPQRRVTRVENNVLYELDGKPALDLYREYLGDKAADLPSSGLLYPFAIIDDVNTNSVGLIRTILDIDEENKSLILAGDIEKGKTVCLMHADMDDLVQGAEDAARQTAEGSSGTANDAVICISCVGRRILMGDNTDDELEAVRDVFAQAQITGFYSYGEISYFGDTKEAELHNQTMTITRISETG
ncbi:MAG: hypothetical protein EA357_05530 [Micavibrio sp.]|jgi:hypothetical protein|nr:MAG: hypothetical protein EA357_05530 [Micavibrio sp.]